MSIQFSTVFCVCIAVVIPLLVLSASQQEDMKQNLNTQLGRLTESDQHYDQTHQSLIDGDDIYNDEHLVFRKAADFEQILKPCNRIPATGRGQQYADCVRSRMLLMGRRKRRHA